MSRLHPHERSVFVRRNAALLTLLAAMAALASADVALGPQSRAPLVFACMVMAAALALWNRVAPLRAGGVAHVRRRPARRRR
jgi:hypothetical protein